MNRRFQFDTRENTASPRQHASRIAAINSSPSQGVGVVEGLRDCPFEKGNAEMCAAPPSEPFVSADQAAQFLSVKRRYLLALARRGIAGAYPLGTGTKRKTWVFRLSELTASIVSVNTILSKTHKPCTIQS